MSKIRDYKWIIKSQINLEKTRESEKYRTDSQAAELIRMTHSIEKGLSITSPRLGFGHAKQKEMMEIISILEQEKNSYYEEVCTMAMDALSAYVVYHDEHGYTDDFIIELKKFIGARENVTYNEHGGVVTLDKNELNFNINEIEKFFNTRHSIRDFDDSDIDVDNIYKAISLAQRVPSACNRQAVRVYVLSKERSADYAKSLQGIGGFEDTVGCFLIITGQLSAYRSDETNQYIVSASMFASYLTLTLHLYGMGSVVVQRPLLYTPDEEKTKTDFNIPENEKIVCLLAVGNLKQTTNVPISHRLNVNTVTSYID